MNYYNRIPETKQGTVFKVMTVSQKYIDCKKDVDKVCMAIKKLLTSTRAVLEEVIPDDATGQIREKYKHCLKHTIAIALEDVDKFIEKHDVTSDEEVKTLRDEVINLLDDVDALFNQG